ncbi:MAG: phosphatase PAP2 family protein [Gemmatimonadaceae bacterium]
MRPRDRAWYLDLYFAAGVGIVALAIWLFSTLVEDVLEKDPLVRWDAAVSAWVHARTTPTGVRVLTALTHLGSATVTWIIAAAGVPVLRRRRILLTGWAAAFLGASILEQILKGAVQRGRPPDEIAHVESQSYSFPSGHTLKAVVCYAMLAFVAGRLADIRGVRRILLYVAAAILILGIGLSRVYLGAHYPSDVFGALTVGIAWLAIVFVGIRLAEHRWGRTPPKA